MLERKNDWDVIVVGGGAAGLGAAFGARRSGANVLILESSPCLGGAMTMRGVASYCGIYTCTPSPRQAVSGPWPHILKQLLRLEATQNLPHRHRGVFQTVDPELTKHALDRFVEAEDISVLYHVNVVSARRNADTGRIESVTVQQRGGQREFYAKSFVDASGDGDLAAYSGASVRYGNNGKVNLGSLATRFTGFAPGIRPTAALWSDAIIAARAENPSVDALLHKNASVIIRVPNTSDVVTFLASAVYDARDAESITRAEISGRRQAIQYLEILRKLPGHENMRLVNSGPDFGTRESRRINCQYQISEQDVRTGALQEDCVALGAWGMEFHDDEDANWMSSFILPGGESSVYDVPYRSICSVDTVNLYAAGRTVDGDRMGGASVRVMGTGLGTGHAAGVAAALNAFDGRRPEYSQVRELLLEQDAIIDRNELGPPVETIP